MEPLSIACRHGCTHVDGYHNCGAQAGEQCNWTVCGVLGDTTGQFHGERIEDAVALSTNPPNPIVLEDLNNAAITRLF